MKYMLLIYADPTQLVDPQTPEGQEVHAAWMRVTEEMAPVTVSGAPLQGLETATTVRTNGTGDPVLSDGPFAETKEFLGGYYVIDVPDLDTATEWASKLPNVARGGSTEVRPVMEFPGLT